MRVLAGRTLTVLVIAVVAAASPAQAKEESKVKTDFEALTDADAEGGAKFKATGNGADLTIKLSGLADGEFTLETNGVERVSFDSMDGKANLHFTTPEADGIRPLFFDPRDGSLVIRDSSDTALLSASLEGAEGRSNLKERTQLEPTALAEDGTAEARFDERPNGKQRLRLHLKGAPAGDYQILFDGAEQEQVTTTRSGNAKATFRLDANNGNNGKAEDKGKGKEHNKKGDLDFDSLNALIEIVRGADLYWSGHLRAQIPGLNVCDAEGLATALEPTEAIATGSADASFDIDEGCVRRFEVAVQDLAPGTVELAVDGVHVGSIEVVDDGLQTSGAVVFSTAPATDEFPLTFDPRDVLIEVFDATETLFTGVLMSAAP